jgi:molybdate transport system substrate-binding protein
MMKNLKIAVVVVLLLLLSSFSAQAQEKISAAVAANYIAAFKELAADFEARTKIKVEGTFSSTGNLYSQITNGAPYDILLSADEQRPAVLYKDGLADQPFVYARGKVILWSANKEFCTAKTWRDALKNEQIKKIAIANPVTAPYGTAAQAALQKAGLWDGLQKKLVFGETIAQTFQYASTSAVDAGFVALSATVSDEGKKGCFYMIAEAPDIIQSACLLKRTKNRAAAEQFAAFLSSPDAQKIKAKFAYR